MRKTNLPIVGSDDIWLKGSRKTIKRTVYIDKGRLWIMWGGALIEVYCTNGGTRYCSVDLY